MRHHCDDCVLHPSALYGHLKRIYKSRCRNTTLPLHSRASHPTMRTHFVILALVLAVRATFHGASEVADESDVSLASRPPLQMTPVHHSHGHAAPLSELNETEVLLHHAPDPLSYWAYDNGMKLGADGIGLVPSSPDGRKRGYRALLVTHVAAMVVAFFGILPIGVCYS